MKQLVEFPLEDGGSVFVEVEVPEEAGMVPAARPGEVAGKAQQTFEAALDRLRPIATTLIGKVRDLSDPPNKVEVEFGLKLSAEAGAILTSAGCEAHCTVTLTWEREQAEGK